MENDGTNNSRPLTPLEPSIESEEPKGTSFEVIYDAFLNSITDDMYMEWSKEETYNDVKNIFLNAMTNFQFPRFNLYDYTEKEIALMEPIQPFPEEQESFEEKELKTTNEDYFNFELTREEINIFSKLMLVEWVNRQLASVDVVRQAYSSRDFEFTSQANHLDKLIKLKESFIRESTKLQRLYGRRTLNNEGVYKPNYNGFGGKDNAN